MQSMQPVQTNNALSDGLRNSLSPLTNKIPNYAICTVYYGMFIIYVTLAILVIIFSLTTFFWSKLPKSILFMNLIHNLFIFVITSTLALFQYLLCDRALLHSK